jgi:hypothetical protein
VTKVIPHFDKYPLKTKKHSDYLLFKEAVMIMQRGEHLTIEGIQKIVNIRASLNKGLTTLLNNAGFANPNSIPFSIFPVPLNNTKLHPQWIAGFTYGDGCLRISIRESKLYKAVRRSSIAIFFI